MPDRIEVGERYRVNIQASEEFRCRACGYVLGSSPGGQQLQGQVVLVTGKATDYDVMECPMCANDTPAVAGVYVVDRVYPDGVPYCLFATWLEPVTEV
jgi:rubredoxin